MSHSQKFLLSIITIITVTHTKHLHCGMKLWWEQWSRWTHSVKPALFKWCSQHKGSPTCGMWTLLLVYNPSGLIQCLLCAQSVCQAPRGIKTHNKRPLFRVIITYWRSMAYIMKQRTMQVKYLTVQLRCEGVYQKPQSGCSSEKGNLQRLEKSKEEN